MNAHEEIKEFWDDETASPPIPHMELMSLTEVASHLKIDREQLLSQLWKRGLEVGAENQTFKQVAEANGRSAEDILRLLHESQRHTHIANPAPVRRGWGGRTLKEV
jgi:hypothetical protein